jgi:hypothetical protein
MFMGHLSLTMHQTRLRIIVCIATLIGLCSYSAVIGPGHIDSLPEALAWPTRGAGSMLRLPADVKVVHIYSREFVVQQRGTRVSVRVPDDLAQEWAVWKQQLQVDDYVSLKATFHPKGYLLLQDMHVHRGRRLKIWVSVLALFVVVGRLIHERTKAFPRSCPISSLT